MSDHDRGSTLADRVIDLTREVSELSEVVRRLATALAGIDGIATLRGERR